MKVYLWDIDGTLIRTQGAGRHALFQTLCEDFRPGCTVDGIPVSGRTDRVIVRDILVQNGIADTEENWQRFRAGYLQRLIPQLERCRGYVLPGVREILKHLNTRGDGVVSGLLTGNIAEGARRKLSYYGLYKHFAFGAFGDERVDRDDIARDALGEIGERYPGSVSPERIWVIGDTPLDIRCAKAIGARSFAVATGSHSLEALLAAEPDVALPDLSDVPAVMAALEQ